MRMDEDLELMIRYRLTRSYDDFWITLHYKNEQGNIIFSSSGYQRCIAANHEKGEYIQRSIVPANFLNWGSYSVDVMAITSGGKHLVNANDVISFTLINKRLSLGSWMGKEPGDVMPKFVFFEEKLG